MAPTKYNPYNAVKSISELKGKWHTAKQLGQDYNQYATAATQYYDELKNNGYGDVADELTVNDYIGSLDILSKYKPDTEFEIDSVYSDLVSSASDIAAGKSAPAVSDSVSQILDSFKKTDDRLNGDIKVDSEGNVVGGLNLDHYNTGKNQLDFLNGFDYTKQSYYDPIMESFKLRGADAAKCELASGASSNSGNIDSYAAANANRQQLAFTSAGHEAARAAAQQNQENWQALYDSMSGNLSDMGAINSQNLAIGADMYATDSAERQNAMNTAAGLADSEAARRLEKYIAELDDAASRYGVDAEVEMNTANNEASLAQLLETLKAELAMNEADNAAARYGVDAEVGMNAANNAAEIDKLIKEYELAAQYGTGEKAEEDNDPHKTLYRDLNDMIKMMQNREDDSLRSYNDVYMAALELYPDYSTEIKAYINNLLQNTETPNNVLTMIQ